MSAPTLISKARTGWPRERRAALAALSTRLALVISVPVFFVFGIAVRRRLLGRARWGIARFLAGASAIAVFLTVSFVMSLALRASPDLAYGDPRGLTIWISSACLIVATLVLCRTPNQTSEPGT